MAVAIIFDVVPKADEASASEPLSHASNAAPLCTAIDVRFEIVDTVHPAGQFQRLQPVVVQGGFQK